MPPGESHVSRISKEYYVNYFNSSHRELGPPVGHRRQIIRLVQYDLWCKVGVWDMSGFLFLIVIDWVMCRVTDREMHGIQWGLNERLEDLDFADDIVLLSHTQKHKRRRRI